MQLVGVAPFVPQKSSVHASPSSQSGSTSQPGQGSSAVNTQPSTGSQASVVQMSKSVQAMIAYVHWPPSQSSWVHRSPSSHSGSPSGESTQPTQLPAYGT